MTDARKTSKRSWPSFMLAIVAVLIIMLSPPGDELIGWAWLFLIFFVPIQVFRVILEWSRRHRVPRPNVEVDKTFYGRFDQCVECAGTGEELVPDLGLTTVRPCSVCGGSGRTSH